MRALLLAVRFAQSCGDTPDPLGLGMSCWDLKHYCDGGKWQDIMVDLCCHQCTFGEPAPQPSDPRDEPQDDPRDDPRDDPQGDDPEAEPERDAPREEPKEAVLGDRDRITGSSGSSECAADGGRLLLAPIAMAAMASAKAMAPKAGYWLLNEALSNLVGYGMGAVLETWFEPAAATHSATETCTDPCRPYPTAADGAEFCSKTVHSHRVHCSAMANAKLRDQFAYVLWEKLLLDEEFKKSVDSPICRDSMIDTICLDAFPHCHCDDKTAYLIACRNVNYCLAGSGRPELDCENSFELAESEGECKTEALECTTDRVVESTAAPWLALAVLAA